MLIRTRRFEDARGWFSETYAEGRQAGFDIRFVQDNHSYSAAIGTVRGIHLQAPPHAQAKLIRCIRGRIMDYAIDLRAGSPTYGQHVATELSAANSHQLFIPVGFGHAFVTLEADTEVLYKVSDFYAPAQEMGVRWDCPDIGIDWPLPPSGAILSPKDEMLPLIADFDSPFRYSGDPLGSLED